MQCLVHGQHKLDELLLKYNNKLIESHIASSKLPIPKSESALKSKLIAKYTLILDIRGTAAFIFSSDPIQWHSADSISVQSNVLGVLFEPHIQHEINKLSDFILRWAGAF